MIRQRNWMGCLVLLALSPVVSAQVPPEKALSTFTVADGLELSLWAAEPLFCNPTCIDIDQRGRVWVCESVNYRCKLRGQPLRRLEGDRILILEDSKGSGQADKVTVFYQAPEILSPLGIAVFKEPSGPGYKVFVCQSPDILVFTDADGDGKADGKPTKLLTGFQGYDHDHGVHSVLIGPDNKLYFTVGDSGVRDLQSSDGKGRKWSSNGTDCRAGTVWRCDVDGKNLELVAHNFRNNYECCVDSQGAVFLSDNDDDGNQQTRICYVMPGGNYGYHPRGAGESHWHEDQPGIVPKIIRTGFGSPTGICVYEGTLLPKKYQGQLIHADAGPREIRSFHLKPNGAGYDVEKELLVTSTDNWFRASDVCVAPDGSLFIADWYDPGVGGHGVGDLTRGRIYRLAPKGNKSSVPTIQLESTEGLATALSSPNLAVRALAQARISAMKSEEAVATLTTLFEKGEQPWIKARALWQFGRLGQEEIVRKALTHPDAAMQVAALRIYMDLIKPHPRTIETTFFGQAVEQTSSSFRRELLLLLRDTDPNHVKDTILRLMAQYDGKDRFYLCAIGICVGQDADRRELLLKEFDRHFPKWNNAVADLIWELRPPSVLPRLGAVLTDAQVPADQRARVVDILAAAADLNAGKQMLKVFAADVPPEVRDKVLQNLRNYLPNKWSGLRNSLEMLEATRTALGKTETRVAGLNLVAVADQVSFAGRVQSFLGDDKQPMEVRTTAVRTLGSLQSLEAVRFLSTALQNGDKSFPLALRVEAALALGTQGARRDQRPETRLAVEALQAAVKQSTIPQPVRLAAAEGLAAGQSGSQWLLQLHEKKELPGDVVADVGRLLRNSPFQAIHSRAAVVFPAPGRIDPKKLPPIAALARRKGDLQRGQRLLAASLQNDMQCLKCHAVRGVGGAVGPDLSMIGKKASRENLLESMLLPSKAVAHEYATWTVETSKGLIVSGLLIEESPQVLVLRDGNGKDIRIDKKEIDTRVKSDKSLMPEDLVAYLTEDDLLDLTEYLLTLKSASLSVSTWNVLGPLDGSEGDGVLEKVFAPEKAVDLKASFPGKAGKIGWRSVRPDARGYVDLAAFHGEAAPQSLSYLYQEIDSPVEQEATLLVGTDDGCKLWVNGKMVLSHTRHEAASPERDQVKLKLQKGVNRILLKINNGDGPHGFFFSMQSDQELKLAR